MATPNLAIAHIASNQNQKEVTANSGFDSLDMALCSSFNKALPDADYTLTAVEALQNLVVVFTGALTADRNVLVPTNKKPYVVSNQTTGGHNIVLKTQSGIGVTVKPIAANYVLVYCDGTNVVALTANDAEKAANKGQANGYASLDGTGKVPSAQIPSLPYTAAPVAVPASATSSGTAGQWACDASYVYFCVAANTWRRAALATW